MRVFDHLDAVPLALPPLDEERHLCRVARAMRADDAWWWKWAPAVVTRSSDGWTFLARRDDGLNETVQREPRTSNDPPPISGEVTAKSERAKRAVWRINSLSDEDLAIAVEVLDEKQRGKLRRALVGGSP